MSSYDVKVLFTLLPMYPALDIIHGRLQQDPLLSSMTSLSIHSIITVLEFCLKGTLFTFQGMDYEQDMDGHGLTHMTLGSKPVYESL